MNDLAIPATTSIDSIRSRIFTIRGIQVMLDRDLAELYGVPTKRLNEQVRRNAERFPDDFMFHLSKSEMSELVANCDRFNKMKHSSVPMTAFSEHGIIMLASVLKSGVAIEASIRITHAFVAMRRALATVAPLLARIEETDRRQIADQLRNDANQARNEERFKLILDAMRDKTFPPQKVFYDGQIYDAFEQMKKFVRMAIVGQSGCPNLTHIVFNNAAHDSVGGQPTVGGEIDFEKIAEELGYNVLQSPQDQYVNPEGIGVDEVASGMNWLISMEEQSNQCKPAYFDELPQKPNFILFKVAKGARKDLGRPKEPPQVNKALYMKTLGERS